MKIITPTQKYERRVCPICGEYAAKQFENGKIQCCSTNKIPKCGFYGDTGQARTIIKRIEAFVCSVVVGLLNSIKPTKGAVK